MVRLTYLAGTVRGELSTSGLLVVGVLVGLLVCIFTCLVAARAARRIAALLSLPLGLTWIAVNRPLEGPSLLHLSAHHGVTVADLLGVLALGLAAWRLLTWRR